MLTENSVVLAKIEAAYGTDPTPTSTENFIAAHGIDVSPNTVFNDTQAQDCSLSPRAGTIGRQYLDITFDYELQGDSNTPLVLPCDVLLKACGYAYSTDATYGIYKPYTSYPAGESSVTLYVYHEDLLWKATGCRGNVEVTCTAGEPVIFSFTFQGLYQGGFDDGTFPTTCTDAGGIPLIAMNQSFDWDSTNHPEAESLNFSLGNTIFARPSLDDAQSYGIGGIDITDRLPEGSFNPMAVKDGTIDYKTHFQAGTQTDIDYVVADANNTVEFALKNTQITNINPGDRSGTRIFDIPFRIVRDSGDDEISIKTKAT